MKNQSDLIQSKYNYEPTLNKIGKCISGVKDSDFIENGKNHFDFQIKLSEVLKQGFQHKRKSEPGGNEYKLLKKHLEKMQSCGYFQVVFKKKKEKIIGIVLRLPKSLWFSKAKTSNKQKWTKFPLFRKIDDTLRNVNSKRTKMFSIALMTMAKMESNDKNFSGSGNFKENLKRDFRPEKLGLKKFGTHYLKKKSKGPDGPR